MSGSENDSWGFNAKAIGCCCCIGVILAIVLPLASIRTVPPAHVGVVVTLGDVSEDELPAGTHITNPFANVISFSTKTLKFEQHNRVPTREGLIVELDVAMLYRLDTSKARDIFLSLGEDYTKVVAPVVASGVRSLTSKNPADALYSKQRDIMQSELEVQMKEALGPRGIIVESVLFNDIILPKLLTTSIEEKAKAEQEAERMEYVLQKETQEAARKKIEAKGIKEFQTVVSQGITEDLLKWKGIEATEKFADNPSSKIVIMGGNNPVILNGESAVSR